MDHAENTSCAHRVRPGQTLCSLCLQHVNEARQLVPARERFVAYQALVQRRMSLQRGQLASMGAQFLDKIERVTDARARTATERWWLELGVLLSSGR